MHSHPLQCTPKPPSDPAAAETVPARRHAASPAVAAAVAAPLKRDDAYDYVDQAHDGLRDEHDDSENGIDHDLDDVTDQGAEAGDAGENGTHGGG